MARQGKSSNKKKAKAKAKPKPEPKPPTKSIKKVIVEQEALARAKTGDTRGLRDLAATRYIAKPSRPPRYQRGYSMGRPLDPIRPNRVASATRRDKPAVQAVPSDISTWAYLQMMGRESYSKREGSEEQQKIEKQIFKKLDDHLKQGTEDTKALGDILEKKITATREKFKRLKPSDNEGRARLYKELSELEIQQKGYINSVDKVKAYGLTVAMHEYEAEFTRLIDKVNEDLGNSSSAKSAAKDMLNEWYRQTRRHLQKNEPHKVVEPDIVESYLDVLVNDDNPNKSYVLEGFDPKPRTAVDRFRDIASTAVTPSLKYRHWVFDRESKDFESQSEYAAALYLAIDEKNEKEEPEEEPEEEAEEEEEAVVVEEKGKSAAKESEAPAIEAPKKLTARQRRKLYDEQVNEKKNEFTNLVRDKYKSQKGESREDIRNFGIKVKKQVDLFEQKYILPYEDWDPGKSVIKKVKKSEKKSKQKIESEDSELESEIESDSKDSELESEIESDYESFISGSGKFIPTRQLVSKILKANGINPPDKFKVRATHINRNKKFYQENARKIQSLIKNQPRSSIRGGLENRRPPPLEKYLKKYGDWNIAEIRVSRRPLNKAIPTLANIITLGKFAEAKKKHHIDTLFHLYLDIVLEDPDSERDTNLVLEKNQKVNIKPDTKPGKERNMLVPGSGSGRTFKEFIERGERGQQNCPLYIYDVANCNCQKFVTTMLKNNGWWSSELNKFVNQDVDKILPRWVGKIAKVATDTAATIDTLRGKGIPELPTTRQGTSKILQILLTTNMGRIE